jgi:hypothetical protein
MQEQDSWAILSVAYWAKSGISEVASLCIMEIPRSCCSSILYIQPMTRDRERLDG